MNQPYIVPPDVIESHRELQTSDLPGQLDHRGMVLRAACELEQAMSSLLLAFLQSVNPALHVAQAEHDLFSDEGLLGSLARMSRLATHLGLLTDDEIHDVRVTTKLRNRYAHGLYRDQFYRDKDMSALVRSLRLYVNTISEFAGVHDQGVFLACQEQLRRRLFDKSLKLATAQ